MSEHKAPLAKRKALGLVGVKPKRLREEANARRLELSRGPAQIAGGPAEFMAVAAALAGVGYRRPR